jgi:hypothetical protein
MNDSIEFILAGPSVPNSNTKFDRPPPTLT